MKKMSECVNSCKYDIDFEDNDYYYIAMEKCDGDLTDLLNEYNNGLPESLIKNILLQLNKAFKMMKEKNIIDIDLKPQNIFIKYNPENKNEFTVKIGDYGFYKEEYGSINFSGPAGYVAPEQRKFNYDPSKRDLWAIGVMIYMLKFKSLPYIDFYVGNIPKKFDDNNLDDLVNQLIVVDPKKRISWEDYFKHPYFK